MVLVIIPLLITSTSTSVVPLPGNGNSPNDYPYRYQNRGDAPCGEAGHPGHEEADHPGCGHDALAISGATRPHQFDVCRGTLRLHVFPFSSSGSAVHLCPFTVSAMAARSCQLSFIISGRSRRPAFPLPLLIVRAVFRIRLHRSR